MARSKDPGTIAHVAIVGAGPGGLCMGKRLLDEGFDNFVIVEKSDGVGGSGAHGSR